MAGEHFTYAIDIEVEKDSASLMQSLCAPLYSPSSPVERFRVRAVLYLVYHHALHDRWYQARDLMLMTHLQDQIRSLSALSKEANSFNTVTMVRQAFVLL